MTTELERIVKLETESDNMKSNQEKVMDKLDKIESKIDIFKDLIHAERSCIQKDVDEKIDKINERLDNNVTWPGLGKAVAGLVAVTSGIFGIIKIFL